MQRALSFYRLMIAWLASLVGGFQVPLPTPCPMEFSAMPEHFIEDAMEFLLFASRIPKGLEGVPLVSTVCFLWLTSNCQAVVEYCSSHRDAYIMYNNYLTH